MICVGRAVGGGTPGGHYELSVYTTVTCGLPALVCVAPPTYTERRGVDEVEATTQWSEARGNKSWPGCDIKQKIQL